MARVGVEQETRTEASQGDEQVEESRGGAREEKINVTTQYYHRRVPMCSLSLELSH
jgi:hypothetical protein